MNNQLILEQAYSRPELFDVIVEDVNVYLVQDSQKHHIGVVDTENIPARIIPMLKIKSWRLVKNDREVISLQLNFGKDEKRGIRNCEQCSLHSPRTLGKDEYPVDSYSLHLS